MAMAYLLPGYEPFYHTLVARIHPVVCVGMIRDCLRTEDGRYFLNLVGICRAKVYDEDRSGDYRRAYLETMETDHSDATQDGEFAAGQLCRQMLYDSAFDDVASIKELRKVCSNAMSLEQVVDLLSAATLPADAVEVRQYILSEPSVIQRAEVLLGELQSLADSLQTRRDQLESAIPGSLMN
jgi:Lon protease-like protein